MYFTIKPNNSTESTLAYVPAAKGFLNAYMLKYEQNAAKIAKTENTQEDCFDNQTRKFPDKSRTTFSTTVKFHQSFDVYLNAIAPIGV